MGAGVGLLFGSAAGADAAQSYNYGSQRQYDNAYVQCMYAQGHRVPVAGNLTQEAPLRSGDAGIPPPPPGRPPAPPPGVR